MRSSIPAPHMSTMPPQSSSRKDRAVALVLAGEASPKPAVKAAGLASPVVQNIRKRVRNERAREEEQRAAAEEEQRLRTATKKGRKPATGGPPTKKKRRWRKAVRQVGLDSEDGLVCRRATMPRPRPRTTDPPRGRSTATSQGPSRSGKRADEKAGALMAERLAAVRAG